jgi:thiamine pyrophosphate-dependent acetolactate synthase large subunit-like protein
MTGAEMVIQALKDKGVEHIFGYPGRSGAADLRRIFPAG